MYDRADYLYGKFWKYIKQNLPIVRLRATITQLLHEDARFDLTIFSSSIITLMIFFLPFLFDGPYLW